MYQDAWYPQEESYDYGNAYVNEDFGNFGGNNDWVFPQSDATDYRFVSEFSFLPMLPNGKFGQPISVVYNYTHTNSYEMPTSIAYSYPSNSKQPNSIAYNFANNYGSPYPLSIVYSYGK